MRHFTFGIVFWLLAVQSAVFSQTPSKDSKIHYRDPAGREESITGIIRKESPAAVVVKPASGAERAIPSASVLDVEYAPPSFTLAKELRTARNQEQAGKLDAAVKLYQEFAAKLPDSPLRRHVEFTVARLTAKHAEADASQVKPAIERLSSYLRKWPDGWQITQMPALLVPLQLRNNDPAGARQTLDYLAAVPEFPTDLKLDCQIASAKLLVDEKRLTEAETKLNALLRPIPRDDPKALRLRVALAECRAGARKFAEAEKELQDILARAKDADTKAYAYNALGDCFRQGGEPRKAMWNYLSVDVLYPQNRPERARALYNLCHVFKDLNDEKKARLCREALEGDPQLAGKYQDMIRKEK